VKHPSSGSSTINAGTNSARATQTTEYQKEMTDRLNLPFTVLSDHDLTLTKALRLPTFIVDEQVLLKPLTMVVRRGVIDHVFYPVFPPDRHAEEVLAWVQTTHSRNQNSQVKPQAGQTL
jgi:peroxiredoxin